MGVHSDAAAFHAVWLAAAVVDYEDGVVVRGSLRSVAGTSRLRHCSTRDLDNYPDPPYVMRLRLASTSGAQNPRGRFRLTARRTTMDGRLSHVLTDSEFAALLEAGPDALVVTDVPGSVLLANAQAEKLFGYDRRELIGKAIETLIPERYRSLRPIGAGRKLHGLRKDGSEFSVELSLTPFRSGNRLWVFAATRDSADPNSAEAM